MIRRRGCIVVSYREVAGLLEEHLNTEDKEYVAATCDPYRETVMMIAYRNGEDQFTYQVLHQALGLPDDIEIIVVYTDIYNHRIQVIVRPTGEHLPGLTFNISEGSEVPIVDLRELREVLAKHKGEQI